MRSIQSDPQHLQRSVFEMDNIHVLRHMNSATVDLIYLDPPYNSNAQYSAPIGSKAAGVAFKDAWNLSDVDLADHNRLRRTNPALYSLIATAGDVHSEGMFSYWMMMAPRLVEMERILKTDGSIYLHCDPTASHFLKLVMDVIFGKENFRNEIAWHYYNKFGRGTRVFARNYDQILFYARGDYTFNPQREKRDKPQRQLVRENVDGVLKNKRDADGNLMYRMAHDKKVDAVWRIPALQPASSQYVGFPTQKPLPLLDRIIKTSSAPGDVVLDPFCGCATTMVAAELLDRKWIGVDLSGRAAQLVVERIQKENRLFRTEDITHRTSIPIRTDIERARVVTSTERTVLRNRLFSEQDGLCNLCLHEFAEPRHLALDHIMPKSRGGEDWEDNFQLLCAPCNSVKGSGTQEDARAKLAAKGRINTAALHPARVPAYRRDETAGFVGAEAAEPSAGLDRKD